VNRTRKPKATKAAVKNQYREAKPSSAELSGVPLADLLDFDQLSQILENFCNAIGIGSAISDLHGKVLAAARWQ